ESVLNQTGFDAALRQLPQLLEPESIALRAGLRIEPEAADELFREAAARSLGNDRGACADVGAGLKVRAGPTALLETHVAEANARHALGLEEGLRPRESGEHVDAERFCLAAEPCDEKPERDDEVAPVVKLRRHRQRKAARSSEQAEFVALGGHTDRRRCLPPFGRERIERPGLHH